MTTEYLHLSEADWLARRRQDITSTESSALFGMSPYSTKFELWHRKSTGISDPFEDNERMEAGRHIEPAIASLVAARYGLILEPMKAYACDANARMGSSFDYQCVGVTDAPVADESLRRLFAEHGPGQIECKNVDGLAYKNNWSVDECPAHIEIQLQHQMELSGLAWGAVVALVGGNRLVPYARLRDLAVGAAIRKAVADFWQSIRLNNSPPVVLPDDADNVIALHQYAAAGTVFDARGNAELEGYISEFDAWSATEKKADEAKKIIKANILSLTGAASKIVWTGGTVSLSQVADTPGTVITEEMVGTVIGERKGYRLVRSYPKKIKPATTTTEVTSP